MQSMPPREQSETGVAIEAAGQPGQPGPDHAEVQHLNAEVHQFDFWLGEWDLTWDGGGRGSNTISRILDGQVIQEQFATFPTSSDEKPFRGLSLSVFVPELDKWRQTWVDSSGNYMDFIGSFDNGKMTLSMERTVNGQQITSRMVFYNLAERSLDWEWERSVDGGQTWHLLWRIHYQRHV
jgi:hypothetical protein